MVAIKWSQMWRSALAVLLIIVGIGAVVEEVSFRAKAERVPATVKEWRSERLFGFRGTATMDLDVKGAPTLFKNRRVRTWLWYRLQPGDQLTVYHGSGSHPVRVDSLWQGFGMPVILLFVAIVWLVETWGKRRQDPPSEERT